MFLKFKFLASTSTNRFKNLLEKKKKGSGLGNVEEGSTFFPHIFNKKNPPHSHQQNFSPLTVCFISRRNNTNRAGLFSITFLSHPFKASAPLFSSLFCACHASRTLSCMYNASLGCAYAPYIPLRGQYHYSLHQ